VDATSAPGATRAPGLFSGRPLTTDERVVVAVLVGVCAGLAAFAVFALYPFMAAKDFTYPWRAARALADGLDPYVAIKPTGHYPFETRFPYPLPTAIAALPFAWLVPTVAGALFYGISAALMAFALSRDGLWRFWAFASAPFAMATALAQWSPLLVAATLLAPLGWALVLKPTLGAALFTYRPTWRAAALAALLVAISLAVNPRWPAEWLDVARHVQRHPAPVLEPFGAIALLALLRWRTPEGRLVAAMACVPQNLYFYDQLPLWLVARNGREAFALSALSWVALGITSASCHDQFFCGREARPWVIWLIYVPATLLVLKGDTRLSALRARLLTRHRTEGAPEEARLPHRG